MANGVGDRLSQTVGAATTHYVLDPGAGLTQVLADGTTTYLYGNHRLAQYQTAMQYFGADGLGSVRQIYDASAQVIGTTRYDPYGSVMSQGGATSVFAFAGEQQDATGLTYLRARYYSAAQGRFTTRDVWEGDPNAPMSYNAWLYAYANSVNLTDPSGRDPFWCLWNPSLPGCSPTPTPTWTPTLPPGTPTLPPTSTPTCTPTPTIGPAPTLAGGLESEARAVARMLYAEERSEPEAVWRAAAWVVRNRVEYQYRSRTTYEANIETAEFAKISEAGAAALTGSNKELFNRQLETARAVVTGSAQNPMGDIPNAVFFANTYYDDPSQDAAFVALLNDTSGPVGRDNWSYIVGNTGWLTYYRNKGGIDFTPIPVPPRSTPTPTPKPTVTATTGRR